MAAWAPRSLIPAGVNADGMGGAWDLTRLRRRLGASRRAAQYRNRTARRLAGGAAAAGGATPGYVSLDVDDVAGETDQDQGEGRAPFPDDRLPDGGGGGAATDVPDHFGTD